LNINIFYITFEEKKKMNPSYPFIAQHRTELNHLNYYYYVNAFTDDELDTLIRMAEKLPKQSGMTGGGDDVHESNYRISDISWIPQNEDFLWVYERITNLAMAANAQMWNFDLWGYHDDLQYTVYNGGGGHYDWHADLGPNMSNRKLSCVIQLSDPKDYEGGTLELNQGNILEIPKERGLVCFFSSFTLHRVTPVTSGKRISLVSWISGPNFR
jgi:PKHD-type hydroxylase